jgi:nucleotide-binding universal stress UspA family protein
MTARLLIAFDRSAAAEAAVRAAAALFPGARATVLTIHEPAISPATVFRTGGALMSPEVVERSLTELERELVAEPAVAAGARQPWEPIVAASVERRADLVVCASRGAGRSPGPCSARRRRACSTTPRERCSSSRRPKRRPTARR